MGGNVPGVAGQSLQAPSPCPPEGRRFGFETYLKRCGGTECSSPIILFPGLSHCVPRNGGLGGMTPMPPLPYLVIQTPRLQASTEFCCGGKAVGHHEMALLA